MPGRPSHPPVDFGSPEDTAINADEESALLPKSGEHHGGGSAFSAFFTMASACAGAGILSLPYAASLIGVVPVLVVLVVFGFANSFTLWVLARLTDLHRNELSKTQFSYEQLVLCVFGPRVGAIFSWIIVLTQFGSLTAYWVILLDLSIPVMESNHWLTGIPMHTLRASVAYFLAVVVLFPLSFYEKIHDLWAVVVLAIASVVWTAGILMDQGLESSHDGTAQGRFDFVDYTPVHWVVTLPSIVFTFNCHQQLTPVYGCTRQNTRDLVRRWVLPASIMFCSVTYMLTAVSGYVKFGDTTKGDILKNFDNTTLTAPWKANSSKLLMALHVVLVYPVVLFPLLRALDSELPKKCTSKGSMVGTGVRNLTVVLLTATLAIFLPNVQVVFGFVGGVLAAQSVFIFPCAMMLYKLMYTNAAVELADTVGINSATGVVPNRHVVFISCVTLLAFGIFLVGGSLYVSITGS